MRIESIETFQRDVELAVVRIRTDDGAEGIGQISQHRADLSVHLLHEFVAPHFLGADPWSIDVLTQRFVRDTYKFPSTFALRALSGIDTAIWDLLGQVTGQPVYNLLGGKARDSVPVYASSMSRRITPEAEAERLTELVETYGFRCVKVRLHEVMGRDTDAAPGRTEKLVPLIRETLGPDVAINADANGAFSVSKAIRVGRLLEEYDYHHFEEPCPYQEIENSAKVAAALDIPVAGGEQDAVLEQIQRMVNMRAVDILQPDVNYIGGMARARRAVLIAEAAGIPCTPHCPNQSLLQVFTLHLATAFGSVSQYQEWGIESYDWVRDLYDPMPQVVGGEVVLGDAPGWGVTVNPDFLATGTRRVSTL
ncbi:mandelate racemase/muconate lactonizing enzyme family protein [Jiangella mangrovi]|uniref:L-alanine-DL-glutamate epimerase-like enolase superfamily enzyme n=1 Tax=Jiangella mangrovi TaxID=1524084 RepID=A0A7W9LP93_9ACTN|nr:mandelate racemase/muconate lactonizing enzyme family protein [Jiangella mangrovi]MBB5791039.1 L-alanine-DL-glutamate epimerase-like enolase superfamily enzyme [Jiangella mangrovi]